LTRVAAFVERHCESEHTKFSRNRGAWNDLAAMPRKSSGHSIGLNFVVDIVNLRHHLEFDGDSEEEPSQSRHHGLPRTGITFDPNHITIAHDSQEGHNLAVRFEQEAPTMPTIRKGCDVLRELRLQKAERV